jgi:hypothetical protein
MDDERQPVDDGEHVLRRIHRQYYREGLPLPINRGAFNPTEHDTTGLTVFRERFATPAETLSSVPEAKRGDYYVARLAVRELRARGLSVVPEPDPDGPPGHVVVPELSYPAYQADKKRLKEVQLELARLASADVVHRPG